jgi:hypothetical protein
MDLYEQTQREIKREIELNRREKAIQERENKIVEIERNQQQGFQKQEETEALREQISNAMRGI